MQRRCNRPGGKHFFEKSKRNGIDYDCRYCTAHWVAIRWALFAALKDPNVLLAVRDAGTGHSRLIITDLYPTHVITSEVPESVGK